MTRRKFPRQNWFRNKKIGTKWRRPKGDQSKVRMHIKGRAKKPNPGYGSPTNERFLLNGLKPVIIKNEKDLVNVKKEEIAVLSSSLGLKKIIELSKIANKSGVRIFNKQKIIKAEKILLRKKRDAAKQTIKKETKDAVKEDKTSTINEAVGNEEEKK